MFDDNKIIQRAVRGYDDTQFCMALNSVLVSYLINIGVIQNEEDYNKYLEENLSIAINEIVKERGKENEK